MRTIQTKALVEGMVPCRNCKEGGRRAYTYIATLCPYDTPDVYAIRHWCDTGGSDASWGELKRYCHGYVGPDYIGPLCGTKEAAISEWNRKNTSVLVYPVASFVHTFRQMLGLA